MTSHPEVPPADPQLRTDGSLSILTLFDPVFLIIALLSALPPHFLPLDELWDSASQLSFTSPLEKKGKKDDEGEDEDKSFGDDIVRFGKLGCVRQRLEKVCETKGALFLALRASSVFEVSAETTSTDLVQLEQNTTAPSSTASAQFWSSKPSNPRLTFSSTPSLAYSDHWRTSSSGEFRRRRRWRKRRPLGA